MECSLNARLLFIGMWNFADDLGRLPLSPKTIKAQILPGDELSSDDVLGMIQELSDNGLVLVYHVDNRDYLQITGWQHQRIDKPQPGKCPSPVGGYSKNVRGMVAPDRKGKEEIGEERKGEEKKDTPLRSDDWPKDFGDLFWRAFPRKTEKLSAMKKLATIRKSGIVTFADLMAGVKRYSEATRNTEQRYVKHPTTWLNAGCWADELQTGGGSEGTRNTHKTGHDAMFAVLTREARKIAGDSEMAGPADASEFPLGNGTVRSGAQRPDSPTGRDPEGHDGRKSGSGGVLEGEVIAPGEANDGLSGNWRHH